MNHQNKRFEKSSFFNQLFSRKIHRRSNSPTPSEASLASIESEQSEIMFISSVRPESQEGSEISGFRELVGLEHKNRTSRDYWMRDEKVKECYDCKQQFTAFRRRHHCRICGQIFCHRCASSIVSGEQFGYQGEIRACNYCINVVDDYYKNPASHKVNIPSQSLDRNRSSLQLGKQPSLAGSFTENKDGFRKMKSPTFYEKVSDVPFRNRSISDDQMDTDQDIFEEEYTGFQNLSNPIPKSFVKERIPSLMDDVLEEQNRTSVTLLPRRKFSTRGINSRYITQIQYISPSRLEFEEKTLSHFRSVSESLNVDINAASVNHVRKLMHQMLQNANINRIEEWEEIIVKMLLNVCHRIAPDVRNGDEIDVRNYVKIKKIQGGNILDSHYVNGVVASKNVSHKKMLKPVQNPKILLLTFALEFQRVQNQYMSLDPLIAQEREHLKNLVGRLLALKPDIVMVEKTVARLALEFFVEADIIVIQNVKANVLSAVARCSKADIIHSIDKLSLKSMGTCEKFYFKTFLNKEIPGIRKTFMFMEGCSETLGCTMVLRGGSTELLSKVKEIVDFLVFVVYSLKLETCLFQDQYVKTPPVDTTVDNTWSQLDGLSALDESICKFKTQILSSSPNVIFPLPYVLRRMHEQEKLFPLTASDHKSLTAKEEGETDADNSSERENIIETIQNPTSKIPNLDLLTPYTQQSIMVMYSNISVNSMVHCIPPLPHLIEYYRDTDLTLGQFIEDTCFGSKFKCPVKACEQSMLSHYRSYAHASGKVMISVDTLPCPVKGMEDRIVMWSLCRICQETTPFIPMSEETWKYSFGKYLELTFYHQEVASRSVSCSHDFHKNYYRFFAFREFTIKFQYDTIELFEISAPPISRVPNFETIHKIRQIDMETISNQISSFYDSVLDRIEFFTYDIVAPHRVQMCREHMAELSAKAHMEKKFMLQLLHQKLTQSAHGDLLSLNSVYKNLLENVTVWDAEFATFIRIHLQSDGRNDLRRLTTVQIKRMFVDKENENRATIFPGMETTLQQDNSDHFFSISKSKLPKLNVSKTHELVKEYFTPAIKRRLSLDLINCQYNIPTILDSPVLRPNDGDAVQTLMLTEEREPLVTLIDTVENYPSRSLSSVIEEEEQQAVATDGIMYPRHFFTRSRPKTLFDSATVVSTSTERNISDEDEGNEEFNTITGVAAEPENNPRRETKEIKSTSLMKTITNIWNGNPANFLPLIYPLSSGEHIFPDSQVIVRESEPSSIVAFALTSIHYLEKLKSMRNGDSENAPAQKASEDPKNRFSIGFEDNTDVEETLLKDTGTHVRYQFWDGPVKFHCKIFFAEKFDALRRNCGIAGNFEQSLARCVKWDTSGGKSNSFFLKTRDDWLVVKNISPIELEALVSFSPAYFEYMTQALFHKLPTVLAKIFGFYQISFKNPTTRKTVKMDILVMEHLFFERTSISRIFDLKGSIRNRHVQSTGKVNEVLLDKNLLEFIYESPLFIREHSKKMLRASVYNDTLFLSKLNVMDYSLLVGIDNENNELVIGIVDFIRTFTWDKKLESWVKESGLLGGGKEPTIVTPRQYKNRFREAMEKYFLMVPEKFVSTAFLEIEGELEKETYI